MTFSRTTPIKPGKPISAGCGKRRYKDEIAAKIALAGARRKDGPKREKSERRAYRCPRCAGWHLTALPRGGRRPATPAERKAAPRRDRPAEFSPKVRAMIRERAGFCCEACGIWLGERGGQIQHRLARGAGGSRNPLLGSAANGALLCGTPETGDHGLCEARDEQMRAQGFWIRRGSGPGSDPLQVPVMLHSRHGSGITVWLTRDGGYAYAPPEAGEAA